MKNSRTKHIYCDNDKDSGVAMELRKVIMDSGNSREIDSDNDHDNYKSSEKDER
jgi:hypothetical protein